MGARVVRTWQEPLSVADASVSSPSGTTVTTPATTWGAGRVVGYMPADGEDQELWLVMHDDGDREDLDRKELDEALAMAKARGLDSSSNGHKGDARHHVSGHNQGRGRPPSRGGVGEISKRPSSTHETRGGVRGRRRERGRGRGAGNSNRSGRGRGRAPSSKHRQIVFSTADRALRDSIATYQAEHDITSSSIATACGIHQAILSQWQRGIMYGGGIKKRDGTMSQLFNPEKVTGCLRSWAKRAGGSFGAMFNQLEICSSREMAM
eukprot:SAG31_NODE_6848_length_1870_cov_2.202146_2_plen_265_part_00